MGKAARNMLHQVIAEEHKDDNSGIKVLNYAPGPLDTDMQREIREAPLLDRETQAFYTKMKENGKLVTCEDSTNVLLNLLLTCEDSTALLVPNYYSFESGSHVDYFDVISRIGS